MRRIIVVAGVLVAVALCAGGAVAATHYVITSTRQIKPSVLKHLRGERGRRGKDGPAGPRGFTGATGATGAPGAAGPSGAAGSFSASDVAEQTGPAVYVAPGSSGGSYASCPAGGVALGGGYSGPLTATDIGYDYPIASDTAWDVVISNNSAIGETLTPYAICTTGGSGALSRRTTTAASINTANVARARAAR